MFRLQYISMLESAWNGNSLYLFSKCFLLILLRTNQPCMFHFFNYIVILSWNVITWSLVEITDLSLDFSNHLVFINPAFFLQSSSHSDLPSSNQKLMDWTKFPPYFLHFHLGFHFKIFTYIFQFFSPRLKHQNILKSWHCTCIKYKISLRWYWKTRYDKSLWSVW